MKAWALKRQRSGVATSLPYVFFQSAGWFQGGQSVEIKVWCKGIVLSAQYAVSFCGNGRANFAKKSCLLEILLNVFFTVSDVPRGKGNIDVIGKCL